MTCSFNIRGDYFKARYFSILLACWFLTNQLASFMPLHNVCKFTSKTGGFESYESHQLLCGGMVEVNFKILSSDIKTTSHIYKAIEF